MRPFMKRLLYPQKGEEGEWLQHYCNLMLILFLLYVALYSYSAAESLEFETAVGEFGDSTFKKEVSLARGMKKFIEESGLSDKAKISITARTIDIDLSSPALFESGSAELKPSIIPLLNELLGHLKDMGSSIVVEGHTDNIPIHTEVYASNWELSAARAFSVIRYYIQMGIPPERLVAHGHGEFKPLASNDTEDGRAKNRRIEITVLRGSGA